MLGAHNSEEGYALAGPLQGSELFVGTVDLGLRWRSSPGYHMAGLRPSGGVLELECANWLPKPHYSDALNELFAIANCGANSRDSR